MLSRSSTYSLTHSLARSSTCCKQPPRYSHRFKKYLAARERQRREEAFERYKLQHEKRLNRDRLRAFAEGRRINGVLVQVSVFKKAAQGDNGVVVKAYVPTSCETFTFPVSEAELRNMLYVSLGQTDVALSELYIHEHLTLVADRLMYRWVRGRQTIKLSRRGNGERGTLVSRQGIGLGGVKYVVDIYEYNNDLVVKAYDARNCRTLRTGANARQLRDWVLREDARVRGVRRTARNRQRAMANAHGNWARVMEVVAEQEADDADIDEEPLILQRRGQKELLKWVTGRLFIDVRRDMRGHERHVLMLQYEVEDARRHNMARRVQGMWRTWLARVKVSDCCC